MKKLFSLAAVAFSIASAPAVLHAQAQDVAYGSLTVNFSASFQQAAQGVGIGVTDLNGNALSNGSVTFTGVGGVLDAQSGLAELAHSGGYLLTIGSNLVRFQDLLIDTTTPASPVISALMLLNGSVVSRIPLFTLPSNYSVSAVQSGGAVQISNVAVALAPETADVLNSVIGSDLISGGLAVGTETQYAVLTSASGD